MRQLGLRTEAGRKVKGGNVRRYAEVKLKLEG